jgi:hypothetical protein
MEGLTNGGGRGIVVRIAEVFLVVLPEELHVVGGCDARSCVGLSYPVSVLWQHWN